jgi:hypothetical protein
MRNFLLLPFVSSKMAHDHGGVLTMSRIFSACAAAILALAVSAVSAHAQSRVRAGVLECVGLSGASFIVGSVHEFDCVFRADNGGQYPYVGVVRRVGLDIGFQQRIALAWVVLAPTARVGPGDLAGGYAGVSAGVAVGIGAGANLLVGGSNNTFALQPLSIEGQTGINIAAGVAAFELRPR